MKTYFLLFIFALGILNSNSSNAESSKPISPFCYPNKDNILSESSAFSSTTGPAFFLIHPNVKEYNLGSSLLGIYSSYADFENLPVSNNAGQLQSFFFLDSDDYNHHIFPTCQPSKFVLTSDGHNKLQFRGKTAIFTGGFFSACLRIALADFIRNWQPAVTNKNLSLIFPIKAIYENYNIYSWAPLDYDFTNTLIHRSLHPFYEANLSTTFDLKSLLRYLDFVTHSASQSFVNLFWERMSMYFTSEKSLFLNGTEQTGIKFTYPPNYNVDIDVRFNIEHPPFSKLPGGTMIFEKRRLVNISPTAPTITMYLVDDWGMEGLKSGKEVDWSK